jgi:hypothetical protein
MTLVSGVETSNSEWKRLYIAGGVAALLAGILFRRNWSAEVAPFSQQESPVAVSDWFALLQSHRFLGLVYLNVLDLVNYALVALMLLALYAALRRANKTSMGIALALGFLGIAAFFASNTAFSMLSLSDQYAAATSEAQKTMLLAAGKAMLALSRFTDLGAQPGTAGYLSLLFVAVACLTISIVMLRSRVFNRATAWVGILASALDLAYCLAFALTFAFMPTVDSELISVLFIPAAGLLWMVWHIMVGWQLVRLGRREYKTLPQQT